VNNGGGSWPCGRQAIDSHLFLFRDSTNSEPREPAGGRNGLNERFEQVRATTGGGRAIEAGTRSVATSTPHAVRCVGPFGSDGIVRR
jgi:hypothetical protein